MKALPSLLIQPSSSFIMSPASNHGIKIILLQLQLQQQVQRISAAWTKDFIQGELPSMASTSFAASKADFTALPGLLGLRLIFTELSPAKPRPWKITAESSAPVCFIAPLQYKGCIEAKCTAFFSPARAASFISAVASKSTAISSSLTMRYVK